MSSPTVHSEHGASSAYRWTQCPGSVSMCRGIPNKSSIYALEGTAAHTLGEWCLEQQKDAEDFLGDFIEVDSNGVQAKFEVTEEMAEAVQVYVDFVRKTLQPGDVLLLEQKIKLDKLDPPAPMFGTSDCNIYRPSEKTLFVFDYKHGAGVPVEVKGNKQLKYYALGSLLALAEHLQCEKVVYGIIQPRAPHPDGPIRTDETSVGDLLDFAGDLVEAVEETLKPNAPLKAGSHCKFCSAAAVCPAKRDQAFSLAQMDFEDFVPEKIDPRHMSIETVSNMLKVIPQIEDWIRSLRAYAQSQLETGEAVPGWKLVNKRATRVWVDHNKVKDWAKKAGLENDEIFESKLKSPAQLEKVVGKKNLPEELVTAVSSGYTLAPESDKRQAVDLSAGSEFAADPL